MLRLASLRFSLESLVILGRALALKMLLSLASWLKVLLFEGLSDL